MPLVINELSVVGQAPSLPEALLLIGSFHRLIQQYMTLRRGERIYVHSTFANRMLTMELTVVECLRQMIGGDVKRFFLTAITNQGWCLDAILAEEIPDHICSYNNNDAKSSALAGAAYWNGSLASMDGYPEFQTDKVTVQFSKDGSEPQTIPLDNFHQEQQVTRKYWKRYNPSPKHHIYSRGPASIMDLQPNQAEQVLNNGIEHSDGKQVHSFFQGKFYEFKFDNVDSFHGYVVEATEIETPILLIMRGRGLISETDYRHS